MLCFARGRVGPGPGGRWKHMGDGLIWATLQEWAAQVRHLLEHVGVEGSVLDACGARGDAVSRVLRWGPSTISTLGRMPSARCSRRRRCGRRGSSRVHHTVMHSVFWCKRCGWHVQV